MFDVLAKTMPCRWDGTTIVVLDEASVRREKSGHHSRARSSTSMPDSTSAPQTPASALPPLAQARRVRPLNFLILPLSFASLIQVSIVPPYTLASCAAANPADTKTMDRVKKVLEAELARMKSC